MLEIIIEFPAKTKAYEPLSETERVTTQFLRRLRGIHLRLHLLLIQRFCIRWIMQQASLWCRTNGLSLFNFHFEWGSLADAADSRTCLQQTGTNLVLPTLFRIDSTLLSKDLTRLRCIGKPSSFILLIYRHYHLRCIAERYAYSPWNVFKETSVSYHYKNIAAFGRMT